MDSEEQLPPVALWWPRLSIEGKHEILADLNAPLSRHTRAEIETLLGLELADVPLWLTGPARIFIQTQGEQVD